MTNTSEIVKRLREFADFYSRRPATTKRNPTLTEITGRECSEAADQFASAADRLEAQEASLNGAALHIRNLDLEYLRVVTQNKRLIEAASRLVEACEGYDAEPDNTIKCDRYRESMEAARTAINEGREG